MAAPRTSRNQHSAHLHRFVTLNDRHDTQIFTFILPLNLPRGHVTDIFSKEFSFANQAWLVKFERNEHHIGAYLLLKNCLAGMRVRLNFSFTVVNPFHFTRNEGFQEKAVMFTMEKMSSGRSTFCEITDLSSRQFVFDDGKFLVDLEMCNCSTFFDDQIVIPKEIREILTGEGFLETAYFSYGASDWNLTIQYPPAPIPSSTYDGGGTVPPTASAPTICLVRQSRLDHWSNVVYRVTFAISTLPEKIIDTGIIEQNLDTKGYGRGHPVTGDLATVLRNLTSKVSLIISLEMTTLSELSIVDCVPTSRSKNIARCYDKDRQEWFVQTDILGRLMKVRMFYADIRHVPRGYVRLVRWNIRLLPSQRTRPPVKGINGPFTTYFCQKEQDDGYELSLDIPVEDICTPGVGYADPELGSVTIEVEWMQSHLLYHDSYHQYDNAVRLQKYQMSREIAALQAENYKLEKQVHQFQVTLANPGDCCEVVKSPGAGILSNNRLLSTANSVLGLNKITGTFASATAPSTPTKPSTGGRAFDYPSGSSGTNRSSSSRPPQGALSVNVAGQPINSTLSSSPKFNTGSSYSLPGSTGSTRKDSNPLPVSSSGRKDSSGSRRKDSYSSDAGYYGYNNSSGVPQQSRGAMPQGDPGHNNSGPRGSIPQGEPGYNNSGHRGGMVADGDPSGYYSSSSSRNAAFSPSTLNNSIHLNNDQYTPRSRATSSSVAANQSRRDVLTSPNDQYLAHTSSRGHGSVTHAQLYDRSQSTRSEFSGERAHTPIQGHMGSSSNVYDSMTSRGDGYHDSRSSRGPGRGYHGDQASSRYPNIPLAASPTPSGRHKYSRSAHNSTADDGYSHKW